MHSEVYTVTLLTLTRCHANVHCVGYNIKGVYCSQQLAVSDIFCRLQLPNQVTVVKCPQWSLDLVMCALKWYVHTW